MLANKGAAVKNRFIRHANTTNSRASGCAWPIPARLTMETYLGLAGIEQCAVFTFKIEVSTCTHHIPVPRTQLFLCIRSQLDCTSGSTTTHSPNSTRQLKVIMKQFQLVAAIISSVLSTLVWAAGAPDGLRGGYLNDAHTPGFIYPRYPW
ncbi:hypothetical protein B0T20DRAFT_4538 [Sordaria brevicollis]|uniref:Uncharacterized protein n=1 Tax=Sordaria brevicollis TaxID=83679 RepID=A0AAE0UFS7_SORBR|nr:hypothetical protein B0T20DRAFT_4538 [Sordaria brevicollis]